VHFVPRGFGLRNVVQEDEMTMKLHVANVPLDATEDGLRRHFSTCGGVADVELLFDARTNRARGLARVTMTSTHFAEQAMARLDGVAFGESILRVTDTAAKGKTEAAPKVKIMQQFRERGMMVYDLDCAGSPLTVRIGRDRDGVFHVEVRSTEAEDAIIANATAPSGKDALEDALRAWNTAAETTARIAVDADAIARAMRDVKAN
jgi:RNA recognition motif-containing protein